MKLFGNVICIENVWLSRWSKATHATQMRLFWIEQPLSQQTEKCLRCNDGITSMIHILSHFARAKTLFTETMIWLCFDSTVLKYSGLSPLLFVYVTLFFFSNCCCCCCAMLYTSLNCSQFLVSMGMSMNIRRNKQIETDIRFIFCNMLFHLREKKRKCCLLLLDYLL